MAIRYRHHPDPDLYPGAAPSEGEAGSIAELEALVLLGSVGPGDEVALDGRHFKKATRVAELRGPLEKRYGEPGSVWGRLVFYGLAALLAVVAVSLVFALASKLLKLAVVLMLIGGAVWLWRSLSGRGRGGSAGTDIARKE